jgi:hypothetical protein
MGILPSFINDLGVDFSKGIMYAINGLMMAYLTDSLVANLGAIAHSVMLAFTVDYGQDGNFDIKNPQSIYFAKWDDRTSFHPYAIYVSDRVVSGASIENGKLPSAVTGNFG